MKLPTSIKLDEHLIDEIRKFVPTKVYSTNCPLFYEGQTPVVAYLVVEGSIHLIKNKKIKSIIKEGNLVGLNELMNNLPSKYSAEALLNTQLCFLDKSTVFEIIEHNNSTLSQKVRNIISIEKNGWKNV